MSGISIREPEILILDEATAAMDFELEDQLLGLIREYITQRQAGLLMITHQPMLAARADRILLLKEGRISYTGTHAELMQYENGYSRAINRLLQPSG